MTKNRVGDARQSFFLSTKPGEHQSPCLPTRQQQLLVEKFTFGYLSSRSPSWKQSTESPGLTPSETIWNPKSTTVRQISRPPNTLRTAWECALLSPAQRLFTTAMKPLAKA